MGRSSDFTILRNESGGVTVEIRLPYVTQVEDGIIQREKNDSCIKF